MLICPLCRSPLTLAEKTWSCCNGHRFDQAKEGYVNLLAVQHKRSKQPGDNSIMLRARRQFLSQGHYAFLSRHLVERIGKQQPQQFLDLGCGDGYFTAQIHTELEHTQCYGIDVSKAAIKLAAKASQQETYLVASNHRLPLADNSIDCALRNMAPSHQEELERVLTPKARLLIVRPGPRHLYQLKQLIYSEVKLHRETADTLPHFTLQQQHKLHSTMLLDNEQMQLLSEMTPLAWRKTEALKKALTEQAQFEVEAEFMVDEFQFNPE